MHTKNYLLIVLTVEYQINYLINDNSFKMKTTWIFITMIIILHHYFDSFIATSIFRFMSLIRESLINRQDGDRIIKIKEKARRVEKVILLVAGDENWVIIIL